MSTGGSTRHRLGSRTVAIVERRGSLVRLLIALFIARMIVTVTEIIESEVTWFSAVVTVAIGLEAWRAWRVSRVARRTGDKGIVALPDTVWNRMLEPLERRGPLVLYVLTALYAGAFGALLLANESRGTLLTADQAGLDYVAVQDHPYQRRFLDTWTLLSYVAARTERVRLVPDVLNLPLRLPSVIAKSAASLDLLTRGRVELG